MPRQPFADVVGQGVGDFVRQHRCQLVVVLDDAEQAREDADLAAGHAKGVDLLQVKDGVFPLEKPRIEVEVDLALQGSDHSRGDDLLGDVAHPIDVGPFPNDAVGVFLQEFAVRLPAEFEFLLRRQRQVLRAVAGAFAVAEVGAAGQRGAGGEH